MPMMECSQVMVDPASMMSSSHLLLCIREVELSFLGSTVCLG